jgi:hypothetical protein
VDRLLDEGADPAGILVLTTGEPHPWQQHEQSFGADAYWRQATEGGDVFYAAALDHRGLRRPNVVVAVNGFADEAGATAALAAAVAAGDTVYVCGDLERVGSLLG